LEALDWSQATGFEHGSSPRRSKADEEAVGTASKINAVRVFKASDNTLYLYIGGTKDGKESVWRYKIENQEITPANGELYFDFSANYPGKYVLGLTFSNDGDMYIGTDADAAIVIVDASKNFKPFLSGVVLPKFLSFVWDSYDKTNGKDLVYARASVAGETDKSFSPKLLSAMTFKQGAPYYGLEL
jgi:WD40 repeat protein